MAATERRQVIVVGAGLAGLVTARRLVTLGLDVLVLEARDRVGGRVWSVRLRNGEVVELGGEWIAPSQTALIDLVGELGLGLVGTGIDFVSRDPVGGLPIPADEHIEVNRALARRIEELDAGTLETVTAEQLLEGLGPPGPALDVLRSRLSGTAGAPLAEVAASEIGEEFGVGDGGDHLRVMGGNQRLAESLARGLDLRLGKPVTSVHQTGHEVVVVVRNDHFVAEAVVLAVPLAVLKRLVLEPGPPFSMRSVLDRLGMGVAMKVAVTTRDSPPMFRRQDLDISAWYWSGAADGGGVRRAVTGFAGTRAGVTALGADPRSRLARAAPEAQLVGAPIVADWSSDVFAGGCYSVIGPGQRHELDVLGKPWRRVVLAGEHVNGSGTMEGAIRSGEAAAERIATQVF